MEREGALFVKVDTTAAFLYAHDFKLDLSIYLYIYFVFRYKGGPIYDIVLSYLGLHNERNLLNLDERQKKSVRQALVGRRCEA